MLTLSPSYSLTAVHCNYKTRRETNNVRLVSTCQEDPERLDTLISVADHERDPEYYVTHQPIK